MTETASTTTNRTLRQLPNATYRPREYLTKAEVERLIEAARRRGRNGARDAAAILLAYRHGLRAAELCQLRWSQIDLRHGRLHVNRAQRRDRKRASLAWARASSVAAVAGTEPVRVRDRSRDAGDDGLVLADGSADRAGSQASVSGSPPHAAAFNGYKLANDGHDTRSLAHYLGHRNLQSTARYTALAPDRFAKFWQD
jgi:type 1 fimbriae regulatory protein FimE